MKTFRVIIISILISAASFADAQSFYTFHCDKDTTEINDLLRSEGLADMSPSDRVAFFAERLSGAPSDLRASVLQATEAPISVNIHSFNPVSLISTVIALAQAYETSTSPNWRDFAARLENVEYKGGEASDYVSRFLYGSDWIVDNIFRGNVQDVTSQMGLQDRKKEKSIDYISHNRDKFAAFKDDKEFDRLKMVEMGFRNHQIPYITPGDLINLKRFSAVAQNGDLVFLLAKDQNLDFRDFGVLLVDNGKVRFLHVSQNEDKVMVEPLTLDLYVKRYVKKIDGARIIRIK